MKQFNQVKGKRSYLKQVLATVMVMMLMVGNIPNVSVLAAPATISDVSVDSYVINDSKVDKIYKDTYVTLSVNLKNKSSEEITVEISMNSYSAFAFSRESVQTVTIPANTTLTNAINTSVVFDGRNQNMIFDIEHAGQVKTYWYTATISTAQTSGPNLDPVGDIALQLSSDIPELVAEDRYESFNIVVKNVSQFTAFSPILTVVSGSEGTEDMFRLSDGQFLSEKLSALPSGASAKVPLKLYIPSSMRTGYYTIKLRLDCTNRDSKSQTIELEQKIYINNDNFEDTKNKIIKPVLRGIKISPITPVAGQKFKLILEVENKGNATAKDVEVMLSGLSATGIYTTKGVAYKNIESMEPGEVETISFDLQASPKADGVSPVSAVIKYNDNTGVAQSVTTEVSVPVKGIQSSFVEFSQITTNRSLYQPGETATATVVIKNVGSFPVKNAKLRVEGFSGVTAVLVDGLKTNTALRNVGTLAPGQVKTYTYKMNVSKKISVDVVNLKTTLSFIDGKGEAQNVESAIYLFATPDKTEAGVGTTPRVIIEKYNIDTDGVTAGREFGFNFTLKNTSKDKAVKNMKVTVSSTDGIFNAVEGSNTFFIENIGAQKTKSVVMPLIAKNDAETKSYPLTVAIEYEDSENKQYTSTENINLRVLQPQILELNNTNIPTTGDTMSGLNISFTYINKGKTPLLNLNVILEGEFMTDTKENFLGNIPAGNMANFEATLLPNQPGPLEGNIIISYEDAVGVVSKQEIPIKAEIMETTPGVVDPGMPEPMPEPENKPISMPIIIGGGVAGVVVLAGVGLLIKKRLRKKKEALEDEED